MRLLRSNVFWSGLEAATSAVLSFVSAFIVARLIGPGEVGVGASVVALHVLLWVVVTAFFADALVQRAVVDDEAASSAVWASGAVGLAGAAIQAGFAWVLADAIGDRRIVAMSLVLALPLPIVGIAGAMQGLLTRKREYKVLAGRALIGQGLGTITGVVLAFLGAGAWAAVMQQFTTSFVGALSIMLRAKWRPRLLFRRQPVRELLKVGTPMVLNTLVVHMRYRLFALLIGGTAGPTALGHIHMAFRLVDTVRELVNTAMWRLALPTMSEQQRDLPALRACIARFLDLSSLVLFPAMGAMLVSLQPLVKLLLGPVWAPSANAALVLVFATSYEFLRFPASIALVARGVTHFALISSLAFTILTVTGVLVLRPATPLAAVALWFGAQLVVSPAMQVATARRLNDSALSQMRAGLPALGLTALATAAALLVPRALGEPHNPALLIAVRLAIGASFYLVGALLLLRGSVMAALRSMGLHRRPA